jgi:hypothetical protein
LAQTPPAEPEATPYLTNVSRLEAWSFFEPPPGDGDPRYFTLGNRATLGVRVKSRRLDVDGAVSYAQLVNLPEDSIGPGALGNGALYFFSAAAPAAFQLYFKRMWLRVKDVVPSLALSAGRMDYSSGEESSFDESALDELQRRRVGARLIGNFEGSTFERSFDAARADVNRTRWAAHAGLLFPSQGGYEESANPTISSVKLLTASATLKPTVTPGQGTQFFLYHYRDQRDVEGRPDNVLRPALRADIDLATFGASQVNLFDIGRGAAEVSLWMAVQVGDWYGQDHRASSASVTGGYRFNTRGRPFVGGGLVSASGDTNPADDRHETFFQMVPSIDRYVPSAVYSLMNIRDAFAEFSIQPHTRLQFRADVHHVSLAQFADQWYYGSGATSRVGSFFGFASRPSRGATSLGTIAQAYADLKLKPAWTMRGYFGVMRGGEVVRRSFAGSQLLLFQLENRLSF